MNDKAFESTVEILLQIPAITLVLILYVFLYGVQVQKKVVGEQIHDLARFILHPIQVVATQEQKEKISHEINVTPVPPQSAKDKEALQRNAKMITTTFVLSAALIVLFIVILAVFLHVQQRSLPWPCVFRSLGIICAVLLVEVIFLQFVLTDYKVLDIQRTYIKILGYFKTV